MGRFNIKRKVPRVVEKKETVPPIPVESSDSETPTAFSVAFEAAKRNEVEPEPVVLPQPIVAQKSEPISIPKPRVVEQHVEYKPRPPIRPPK